MTLKSFLSYSVITNVILVGAVAWQNQVHAEAIDDTRSMAIDEDVTFREYVARELASEDPERIEEVQFLCERELDALRPHLATIWDAE
ncbi:MAG: hypothetical protein AAF907_17855 [Planctomycetota bacterium]